MIMYTAFFAVAITFLANADGTRGAIIPQDDERLARVQPIAVSGGVDAAALLLQTTNPTNPATSDSAPCNLVEAEAEAAATRTAYQAADNANRRAAREAWTARTSAAEAWAASHAAQNEVVSAATLAASRAAAAETAAEDNVLIAFRAEIATAAASAVEAADATGVAVAAAAAAATLAANAEAARAAAANLHDDAIAAMRAAEAAGASAEARVVLCAGPIDVDLVEEGPGNCVDQDGQRFSYAAYSGRDFLELDACREQCMVAATVAHRGLVGVEQTIFRGGNCNCLCLFDHLVDCPVSANWCSLNRSWIDRSGTGAVTGVNPSSSNFPPVCYKNEAYAPVLAVEGGAGAPTRGIVQNLRGGRADEEAAEEQLWLDEVAAEERLWAGGEAAEEQLRADGEAAKARL